MMVPVRCFSCGAPIGEHYLAYKDLVAKGKNPKDVMDELGVTKYCCRRVLLTTKEYIKDINSYQK